MLPCHLIKNKTYCYLGMLKTNLMRIKALFIGGAMFLLLGFTGLASGVARELPQYLLAIPEVQDIDTLETSDFFSEKYLVLFKQEIDHGNPDAGYFTQRVFISHYGFNSPVVYTTEGYTGSYAEMPGYVNELSAMFEANQIVVEHRYFDQSVPEPFDWKYLTTANAAADHHAVFEALKPVYKEKWISTGISKGGETAMLYNMYYPDDVDICVAYVGPVAFAVEDGRHEPFIASVSTGKDRKRILSFQKEVLKRRSEMIPLLEAFSKKNKLTYRVSIDEVLDYCVLEFSFAFWQWGASPATIPGTKASTQELFRYLVMIASPDYFAIEGIEPTLPFFYQAARELGYYGYDVKPFKKYLSISSAEGYLYTIFLPPDLKVDFIPETSQKLADYMQHKAHHTILIYGEFDPWSAAAVDVSQNPNVLKVISPAGSHMARIKNLPKIQHDKVINTITQWLNEK